MDPSEDLRFDFDVMAQLATCNPTEFVRQRDVLISQFLGKANKSDELAALQMELDANRYGASPGIPATQRINAMILKKINSLEMHLDSIEELIEAGTSAMIG
ncbi:MAG: DUF3135 domain-containing protein [Rhodoferax sp.]|nr:DUF3135 domain-containing protein [Rhodoferax sp.]